MCEYGRFSLSGSHIPALFLVIVILYCVWQVAKEIWVCEGGKVKPWPGDIQSYKMHLKKKVNDIS